MSGDSLDSSAIAAQNSGFGVGIGERLIKNTSPSPDACDMISLAENASVTQTPAWLCAHQMAVKERALMSCCAGTQF